MKMQESKPQSKSNRHGRIPSKLSQTGGNIAQAQPQTKADAIEPTQENESVDSHIQQQHLAEDGEMRRPCAFKPAQIDRKAQHSKHCKIAPVAAIGEIDIGNLPQQSATATGSNAYSANQSQRNMPREVATST